MKSVYGNVVTYSIFGESHGPYIGITINNLPCGLKLNYERINHNLSLRRPDGISSTKRIEDDEYEFISGVKDDVLTGAPVTILIKNKNVIDNDYQELSHVFRPSHSDYAAYMKFHGLNDFNGGGAFSGRLTVALVVAGSICEQILESKNIISLSRIKTVHGIVDDSELMISQKENLDCAFPVINQEVKEKMLAEIKYAKDNNDSVGGIIETQVYNLEPGLGEPFFNSIESELSSLLYSIPGVKGVEFGLGFGFEKLFGSQANDPMRIKNQKVEIITNNNGGINGGITNGNPLCIKVVIKPTPSIGKRQETIDIHTMENKDLLIKGRHDPAIISRASIVVRMTILMGLLDLYAIRYGNDFIEGK